MGPGAGAQAAPQLGVAADPGGLRHQRHPTLGVEEEAGLVTLDELGQASDVAGEHRAAHRHGFQRLERRDELGQAHAPPRADEDVDQRVKITHLVVGNLTGEDHAIPEARGHRPERSVVLSGADEQ